MIRYVAKRVGVTLYEENLIADLYRYADVKNDLAKARACHESKPGSGGSSLREFAYLKSGLATCLKLASRGSKTREFASF